MNSTTRHCSSFAFSRTRVTTTYFAPSRDARRAARSRPWRPDWLPSTAMRRRLRRQQRSQSTGPGHLERLDRTFRLREDDVPAGKEHEPGREEESKRLSSSRWSIAHRVTSWRIQGGPLYDDPGATCQWLLLARSTPQGVAQPESLFELGSRSDPDRQPIDRRCQGADREWVHGAVRIEGLVEIQGREAVLRHRCGQEPSPTVCLDPVSSILKDRETTRRRADTSSTSSADRSSRRAMSHSD